VFLKRYNVDKIVSLSSTKLFPEMWPQVNEVKTLSSCTHRQDACLKEKVFPVDFDEKAGPSVNLLVTCLLRGFHSFSTKISCKYSSLTLS